MKFSIFAFVKRLAFILSLCLLLTSAGPDPYVDYINRYSRTAIKEMERSGVPASITLAQGLLESGAGQSELAVAANNHFGIKCHNWKGRKYYHDDDRKSECFRVYGSPEESFRDHSDFLRYQDRYKSLFNLPSGDYVAWAEGLRKAGYATDPKYPEKLVHLIETYELYRFDHGVVVGVEAPMVVEKPKVAVAAKVRESYRISLSREILTQNGVPFIYAMEGETYASIARENNLFLREILKFNDLKQDEQLRAGEMVYIAAKKKQAAKGVDKFIAESDCRLSLRDISQRFGVRLSSLASMNALGENYVLSEGDTIILRK